MTRDLWRRAVSHTIIMLCGVSVIIALIPLALILFYVLAQGLTSLNLSFFTEMPRPVGEASGGMANSITGSILVTLLGALFAIPIGIMSGVYTAEYAGTRLSNATRFAADTPACLHTDGAGVHLRDCAVRGLAQAGMGGWLVLVAKVPICSLLARVATARMEKLQRGS